MSTRAGLWALGSGLVFVVSCAGRPPVTDIVVPPPEPLDTLPVGRVEYEPARSTLVLEMPEIEIPCTHDEHGGMIATNAVRVDIPADGYINSIRIELVDDVDHKLFAGVRDVHRGEARSLRLGEESADVRRGPAQFDEVEDAVLVLQSQRGRLRLVHRRREGSHDALTDEADEIAGAGRGRGGVLPMRCHESLGTSKSTVASDTLTGAEIPSTSACAGWRL